MCAYKVKGKIYVAWVRIHLILHFKVWGIIIDDKTFKEGSFVWWHDSCKF